MSNNQHQKSRGPSYGNTSNNNTNNTITFSEGMTSISEISFSDEDLEGVQMPHNDPLVIQLKIADFEVKRVFITNGSPTFQINVKRIQKMMAIKDVKGVKAAGDDLASLSPLLKIFPSISGTASDMDDES
ncbi:hypothetical protein NE237_019795 [Protea cynaroides]|uniref:Uncharacterized protein n=1 Tax=Protea cynaroides TaxID=273540 RepID=A0A9Q0K2U9_9MAGN|nr:hypothetical protein NE237_019795 [Protea cynaroides]